MIHTHLARKDSPLSVIGTVCTLYIMEELWMSIRLILQTRSETGAWASLCGVCMFSLRVSVGNSSGAPAFSTFQRQKG